MLSIRAETLDIVRDFRLTCTSRNVLSHPFPTASQESPMTDPKDRSKAVDVAVSQIERQFGKGSIVKLGERGAQKIPVISSGSLSIDYATGVGGVPRGRVVEVFGPESSGKTTLALHFVAEAQRKVRSRRLRGCRARPGPRVRRQARRGRRQPDGLPARLRGAGARDRRDPDPLRRDGRRRGRLRRGAGPQGRAGRRDG